MEAVWNSIGHIPWYGWIGIVVLVGGIIRSVTAMNHRHKERIEMIRQGMDPNAHKR